jgi:hypothetical protein
VIDFPRETGELATPVRVPATGLCLVGVGREHAGFGTMLLSDDARCRSHAVVQLGAALGPAIVAPPASRRRVVLFQGRQDLSASAARPTGQERLCRRIGSLTLFAARREASRIWT